MLLRAASGEPETTALVFGKDKWSYHRLFYWTDRAADMFWGLGIRKGDKVAVALRNSPEFIITCFALAKLGATAVPINFLVSKEEEIGFILKNSHSKGIVTQSEFIKPYAKLQTGLPAIKFLLSTDPAHAWHCESFWKLIKDAPYHIQARDSNSEEEDLALILYTSGTTGHPKGVLLSHKNLLANARSCIHAMHLTKKDSFLCVLPMFHTFSWTTSVIVPIMLGAKTLIISHLTPPKPWLSQMGKEGITVMAAVPQLFSVLAKEAKGFKRLYLRYWPFRKMRFCMSGAAPLNKTIQHMFEKKLNVPLLEGYGLTETSPVVTANRIYMRKHGSVGKPLPGVSIRIINENEQELDSGLEGEICVKGRNVTSGYHADEKATAEIFTADGWIKTGDIGIIDKEGFLFIRDRKKDMIIVKGLKVFPAQVEALILEHPAVAETAVIGIPNSTGDETIKCFCVAKPGAVINKNELMQFMRGKLDPYKRPREIEIMDSLPKNTLHKVLKRVLRQRELEKRAVSAGT